MEYYTATAKQLYLELEQLQYSISDHCNRSNRAIQLIRNTLKLYRKSVCAKGFECQEDEIRFFKHVKPQVSSYLIFYTHIFEIESKKLVLTQEQLEKYVDRKRKDFRYQTYDNLEFVNYYKSGYKHQDKVYFLRDSEYVPLNQHCSNPFRDPEFTTPYDHVASVVLAYELFLKYLDPSNKEKDDKTHKLLKWTDSKISLVELIYGIQKTGSINNGEIEVKEICKIFESTFNIDLKDIYKTFHEISHRKKERTKYINQMGKSLDQYLDELDFEG